MRFPCGTQSTLKPSLSSQSIVISANSLISVSLAHYLPQQVCSLDAEGCGAQLRQSHLFLSLLPSPQAIWSYILVLCVTFMYVYLIFVQLFINNMLLLMLNGDFLLYAQAIFKIYAVFMKYNINIEPVIHETIALLILRNILCQCNRGDNIAKNNILLLMSK